MVGNKHKRSTKSCMDVCFISQRSNTIPALSNFR